VSEVDIKELAVLAELIQTRCYQTYLGGGMSCHGCCCIWAPRAALIGFRLFSEPAESALKRKFKNTRCLIHGYNAIPKALWLKDSRR